MKISLIASILFNFVLVAALAGCASGAGTEIAELLSADTDPDSPNSEIVCVRGTLNGRFTDTNLVYLKKVYPKDQQAPEC